MSDALRVFFAAPARLHFGVLDLRGDLGRRFGGIGAAVPAPSLLVEASPAPSLTAEGPDATRGRALGGMGAAAPAPSLLVEASPAPSLTAEGPDATRVLEFARRFAAHH